MVSITGWIRIEPLPRSTELQLALQAQIADPLWFLARQWQMGEFAAEDAGSPMVARLNADVGHISRYHAGPPPPNQGEPGSIDYLDARAPLEVLVEREPVRDQDNRRQAIVAGLHFARLLNTHGLGGPVHARYLDEYALPDTSTGSFDPNGQAEGKLVAGRVVDGTRLRADLVAHRGAADSLTSLPARPVVTATTALLAAANGFLDWWDGLLDEPDDAPSAWQANRLEYGFSVSAEMDPPNVPIDHPQVLLHADEYDEGDLDWYSFRASTLPQLGQPAVPAPPTKVTRTVIPTPVSYAGQPASRFWAFEDAQVNFAEMSASAGDIGKFMLTEFALLYGDDWFVIPVDLPVGSVAVITSLTITDTFGVTTVVEPSIETTGHWTMYTLADDQPDYVNRTFFLPPTLTSPLVGDAVEEVAFFRDEVANMVWGVERKVLADTGYAVDRYTEHQRELGGIRRQEMTGPVADAEIIYRLASNVPRHWIPFVPVPITESGGPTGAIRLERRSMVRHTDDGPETIAPRGAVLLPGQALQLEEEEVPRAGRVVQRAFQLTRWTDGSTHAWLGRQARPGKGEGASGLRFDFTKPM